MKNCGLRKAYAMGGPIEQMDPAELAQFTNNPDVLNAASTRKWALEDAAKQAKYPSQNFLNPISKLDLQNANNNVVTTLQDNGMMARPQQKPSLGLRQPLAQPAMPQETTFQQDIDARQDRMAAYRKQLGYAGGGTVDPDALMREMAAKYGTTGAQPAVSAPTPTPTPAPTPAPAPQPKPTLLDGLRRIATGGLDERMKKAGFKQGGEVKEGGWIDGPKGVDKVPAKVAETGEDILVSHGERIVNKEQNKALEALAAEHGMGLDDYLEQATGEPVGPSMKKGLRAAQQGWEVDPAGNVRRVGQVAGALPNPNAVTDIAVRDSGRWTSGGGAPNFKADPGAIDVEFRNVPKPAPALPAPVVPPTEPTTAYKAGQAVGKGLNWVKNNPAAALDKAGQAATIGMAGLKAHQHSDFFNDPEVPWQEKAKQAGRDIVHVGAPYAAGVIATGATGPVGGLAAGAGTALALPAVFDKEGEAIKQHRKAAETKKVAELPQASYSNEGRAASKPVTAVSPSAISTADNTLVERTTGAKGATPLGLRGVSFDDGSLRNSREVTNGVNMAASANPEQGYGVVSVNKGGGQFRNVMLAPPEYTAADGSKTSDWSKTAQYAEGVARNERDKQSLERIKRERAEFDAFDPSITDPAARESGRARMVKYGHDDELAVKKALNEELVGLRKGMVELQGRQLDEQSRQFDETMKGRRELAAAQLGEKRVKEVDDLIDSEDWGDKAMNAQWRDFMRANGFAKDGTALSAQEIRKQMPTLKAKFAANRELMKNALDKTTLGDVSGGKVRSIEWGDVDTNRWGLPIFDSEEPRTMSVSEYGLRKMIPGYSDKMYVDPQGNRYRWKDAKKPAASFGEGDMERLMKGK